ncbi:hypothetical protein LY76DRAFT_609383 [Colletotrichum caudatum]|nr:hypothetical protein LY76DRAFT_609383 [Colletotrichum caudatum]
MMPTALPETSIVSPKRQRAQNPASSQAEVVIRLAKCDINYGVSMPTSKLLNKAGCDGIVVADRYTDAAAQVNAQPAVSTFAILGKAEYDLPAPSGERFPVFPHPDAPGGASPSSCTRRPLRNLMTSFRHPSDTSRPALTGAAYSVALISAARPSGRTSSSSTPTSCPSPGTSTLCTTGSRDEIEVMKKLIAKYSGSEERSPGTVMPDGETVVLTGATGPLGAHLFDQVVRQPRVETVYYCFARALSVTTQQLRTDTLRAVYPSRTNI